MSIIKDLLEGDYLLRKLMEAKVNSEGLYMSHAEVCSIISFVLVGVANDKIMNEICFEREYQIKRKGDSNI
ncbi:MAG: hypothetical protein ACRC6E_00115 [Fusobacteriaceae bacterium]